MKIVIDGKTAEVPNGGPTYEAGDGITIQDNVLSVTTPVNTILTQSEFDALPVEQQSKGMYVIDDGIKGGSGSGSSMEIYDDQERIVGTWFGKPIYRKICIINNLSMPESIDYEVPDGVLPVGIEQIVALGGALTRLEDIPTYCPVPGNFTIFCAPDNPVLPYRWQMKPLQYRGTFSGAIWVEYTKTTDPEVIT